MLPSGRFEDWPETHEASVNVLCEGPSILDLQESDLLPGPVVAVNHCLKLAVPVDLWATSDNPKTLWKWSLPYKRPGLRYWTTDINTLLWSELIEISPLGAGERLYAWEETVMDASERGIFILPTVVTLLAWLSKVGAKDIRIFGSDMQGTGSPIGHEHWVPEETDAWEWRWGVERGLLAHAFRRLRSENVRVERWRQRTSESERTSS